MITCLLITPTDVMHKEIEMKCEWDTQIGFSDEENRRDDATQSFEDYSNGSSYGYIKGGNPAMC